MHSSTSSNHATKTRSSPTSIPGFLLQLGGSGVLVLPIMYIFDEETPRWRALLKTLGLNPNDVDVA